MTFYIYTDGDGRWRWYLKSDNGRRIADSSESYLDEETCISAIALIQASIVAKVVSLG
jgi:uncharacterized protein YegP (UPF0339 family)